MAAVATTGGSSREARRRRILERGSDRLALITGRIESLPPEPDQSPSVTCSPGQPPADSAQHEDAASNSSLPNQESDRKPGQHHGFDETVELPHDSDKVESITSRSMALPGLHHGFDETVVPLPHNSDNGERIMSRSVASHDANEELSQIPSSRPSQVQDHQCGQSQRNSLTTAQICSAIAASENIRMCCSVAAAILVILSYIGFPVLGFSGIRGVIIFRPLYLLLLTNISIVLGRVILATQGAELGTGRMRSVPTVGGNALVDQLGKALELWLLLKNISGALFMDFSIYAVVLISGLSLVRRLGW